MTAKEYLSRAFFLDKEIASMLEQIENLKALATRATSVICASRVGGTDRRSKVEDGICRIIEMENQINDRIDELIDTKDEICALIRKIDDEYLRRLLEYRYVCYHSMEEISDKLCYSYRHTLRLHAKALELVQELIDKKSA